MSEEKETLSLGSRNCKVYVLHAVEGRMHDDVCKEGEDEAAEEVCMVWVMLMFCEGTK